MRAVENVLDGLDKRCTTAKLFPIAENIITSLCRRCDEAVNGIRDSGEQL
jgi:hypothetical protein